MATRNNILTSLGLVALAAPALQAAEAAEATQAAQATQAAEKKPLNVILIITDDQGYGDVGYVGNADISTPELDRLSMQSVIFDNFHTGTTSAPTRSGLMTGRYGNSTGVWHTIGGRSLLDEEEYTLAEAFEDSGYSTALFGKWHLGDNYPYRPMDRGFGESLWHKAGGVGQTPDYFGNTYFEDTYFRGAEPEKQTGYCTDVFFGAAEKFIEENVADEKPFFCYLAPNAPHGPYNVDERYAEPFRSNPNVVNAPFYGMIKNLDDNIGELLAMLKRLEIEDNTVIIFFGDNGTAGGVKFDKGSFAVKGYNGGLRGRKGQVFEGGHRQAMLMHVPSMRPTKTQQLAAYMDIMPTLIDLCSLTPAREVNFDGENILSPNYNAKGRVFVNDTQRKEELREGAQYCVARDDWRLISGTQLYDLSTDREQRVNVAKKYPKIVEELKAEYEKWWKHTSKRKDEFQNIPIIINETDSVTLTCHDLHDRENRPNIWNFDLLHTTKKPAPGWWSVSSPKSAKVKIKAYRWNPESGLALGAAAEQGRVIPNGKRYPAGGAIRDMEKLIVRINGETVGETDKIDLEKVSADIDKVRIPKGDFDLQVLFADAAGKEYSAWYATIER